MDRDPAEERRRLRRLAARIVRPVAAALIVAAGGFLVWRHGLDGDLLRIREVRFEGLSRATARELLEISPIQRGDHLALCDTALMETALRRHPWIASVQVRRKLPAALDVRVVERRPAAIVDLGALYLVDSGGEVFKRALPGDGLDLPVITGIGRDDWVERRDDIEPLLHGALALLDRWAERGLDRRAPVSEIHIDAQYGTTLWAGSEGVEVRLGHGALPEKLARLEQVLAALDAEGQTAEVLHLDNRRRPDWVAVRLAGVAGGGGDGTERPRGR